MNKENVFIWNNSALTNSIIKKIEDSSCVNNIYYANNRIINKSSAVLLKSDGIPLIEEMSEKNIKYVYSNSEANDNGFIDFCNKKGFISIGSTIKSSKLEASKAYAKSLMQKYNIKTAEFFIARNENDIQTAWQNIGIPCYIKADGYARSVSAIKINTKDEFFNVAQKYLNGYFCDASKTIIIEKEISGKEISIPLILDGKRIKLFNTVRDYKRRNNHDTGVNTGGMGSVCPYNVTEYQLCLINKLISQIEDLLIEENLFYKGFMTINVIITEAEIYLLEINTRMGDSEGQVIFNLLETDIMEIFESMSNQSIDALDLKFKDGYSMAVNVIDKNYPNILLDEKASISKKSLECLKFDYFFNIRVKEEKENYIQKGNRIISIVGFDKNISKLRKSMYKEINKLEGNNIFFRTDIGADINESN